MRAISTAYLWDESLLEAANARGENYWFAWAHDLFESIGAQAVALPPEALHNPAALAHLSTLALPGLHADYLTDDQRQALAEWVHAGGLLIGMATEGLDEIFGVDSDGRIAGLGPWEISAALRFTDGDLATPLYHPDMPDQEMLTVGDVRLVTLDGADQIAALNDTEGVSLGRPAITLRRVGEGYACLFTFDLAHTVWAIQQGRPIERDWVPDGYLRSSDGMIVGDRDPAVPFTDLLVNLLRNIVALTGQPMIHQLPALDGGCADALFFWGGDDEALAGAQMVASDFMAERGLPYQVNIMPRDGQFTVSTEEFARMRENRTEPSLHLNFIDDYEHPLHFTREDLQAQVRLYREVYGETPVCTVFHYLLWCGWTEPAQWLREEGVLADNSRFCSNVPAINPLNLCGYAYGTSLPFFFRLGPDAANERLDFIAQPINAYESGYDREANQLAVEPMYRAIDNAAFWHATCNMFYHPVCINAYSSCRDAIDEALRYIDERGIRAVHMSNAEITFWWRARSAATISHAREEAASVSFAIECDWDTGYVATVPVPCEAMSATINGEHAQAEVRHEYGRWWAHVALAGGSHEVVVRW